MRMSAPGASLKSNVRLACWDHQPGLLAHGVLLRGRATDEPDLQPGAVHPGLADGSDGARPAAGARGGLRPHHIARQNTVDTNLGARTHVASLVRLHTTPSRRLMRCCRFRDQGFDLAILAPVPVRQLHAANQRDGEAHADHAPKSRPRPQRHDDRDGM